MKRLYLMITITNRVIGSKRFVDFYRAFGAPVVFTALGRGTASDEVLSYLGLEATEKSVMLSVVTPACKEVLMKELVTTMHLTNPGTGIAMCLPLSSIGGRTAMNYLITGNPEAEPDVEVKEDESMKDAAYQLIVAIANQGYTDTEIVDMIELPEELAKVWYTRQYYGTLTHNVKAVYQKYMGWYDANPVHLDELAPSEYAEKLVEYLGDTDKVLEMAKEDYDKGEYQWVAEITNTLIYADPDNTDARLLCADALEQLGYQAESGTWRNAYLAAAQELRNNEEINSNEGNKSNALQQKMDVPLLLDYLGIRLDSNAAQSLNGTIDLVVTDTDDEYTLTLRNGVLLYYEGAPSGGSDATWTTTKLGLFALLQGDKENIDALIQQQGDTALLDGLCDNLAAFDPNFNIVEP